jgi:hypothetical protein
MCGFLRSAQKTTHEKMPSTMLPQAKSVASGTLWVMRYNARA